MAIDGTYQFSVKTPMGIQNAKMTLKIEGNVLTGAIQGLMGGDTPISEGSANGDAFELVVEPKTAMGTLKITITGKVEGDQLAGEAITPIGPLLINGKRI